MRILLLSPDFPPGRGGIQLLTGKLAEGLAADELTVLALAARGSGTGGESVASARVRRVPRVARAGQHANILLYNFFALLLALWTRPETIIAGHIVAVPAARVAARLLRRRYILLLYGQEIPHRPALVAYGARGAHATVAISRHAEDEALKAGVPRARLTVINPGIDLPQLGPILPPRAARPTVVTIARMVDRYKGHDVMIEAIDQIRVEIPEVHWVVIGDGPQRARYERAVAEQGLERNVTFLGSVSDAERDARLATADVFAMPSRVPPGGGGEGFGLVYLEAGAHGVPAVAGDEGGAMDAVVDRVSGLLVDPRSSSAVAAAIQSILSDRELAESLSRGARREARARGWETFTAPVRALLEPGSSVPVAPPRARETVRPRRVLAVSHTGVFGGAERSLITQLSADVAVGECEAVLAAPDGRLAEVAEEREIPVVLIPEFAPSFRTSLIALPQALADLVSCGRRIAQAARSERAELIHANSLRAALLAIAARAFGGPPVVAHVRDVLPNSTRAKLVARTVAAGSTSVVANSVFAAEAFKRASGGGHVTVVYNAVEIDGDASLSALNRTLPGEGPALAVIGQITPWKGHDIAVRTLAAIKPQFPAATLTIVGSVKFAAGTKFANDRFAEDIRELAAALRVADDIVFTGELSDVELAIATSDIVLMPSWEEPFGRAAVEAMACGRPVVATNKGGPAEFIEHGSNGMLATPGVVEEWAAAVRAIATDEELREELGARARETAQRRFVPGTPETSFAGVYAAVG